MRLQNYGTLCNGVLTHFMLVDLYKTFYAQLLLFATSKRERFSRFSSGSKTFQRKAYLCNVQTDNEDIGKPVSDYFGITSDAPTVLGYTGNDDSRKFVHEGEVTLANLKAFGQDFIEDKLKPFFKSDPIPETVNLCTMVRALPIFEPTYNKLAKHLRGIDSIVIAKMDGTTNEHPRAKADGFPTLLFFPAGNKSFDPISVDADRTVVAFYKFLKKNASIPFKLQKPTSTPKSEAVSDAKESQESSSSTNDLRDEL
ncbi:PDI-like 1-4 [Prunus dulcis]|uniref:PDI-like 1-4 n=1 Tax=Prunus dulcis TaxID=3755 RepID=A0A5H2XTU1_PRUDU|nr:PDI-like 1-4 [Prunus dulcis]